MELHLLVCHGKSHKLKGVEMPLIKSKSKNAFEKNISTEVQHGKPVKQAVAIAYSMQRKAHKSEGGLYENIHKKQERIKHEKAEGLPVEHMRKPGSKGAPTKDAFIQSAKTAKKKEGGSMKKTSGCSW